jgi:hypothetical protein
MIEDEDDDHAAYEAIIEDLIDLWERLAIGAKGAGLTLTADECQTIRLCQFPPRPKGRPSEGISRQVLMYLYCSRREWKDGMPLKAAVEATAQRFRCGTSAVYAARKATLARNARRRSSK